MSAPAFTRYRCAICDVRLREGQYVYSHWTRNRYCGDLAKHERIVKARKKGKAAQAASSVNDRRTR